MNVLQPVTEKRLWTIEMELHGFGIIYEFSIFMNYISFWMDSLNIGSFACVFDFDCIITIGYWRKFHCIAMLDYR